MDNSDKRYTATHEWILATDEHITVGITEHAQSLLGDLVFVELPPIGRHVTRGKELGVVESVKAAADFYAPISGEVVAVNPLVQNNAALVNQSPEQEGWLVKLQASNKAEIDELFSKEQYLQQLNETH